MGLSPEQKKELLRTAYAGGDFESVVLSPDQLEWAREVCRKELHNMGEKYTVTNYFTQMMNGAKLSQGYLDEIVEFQIEPQTHPTNVVREETLP